ncbi:hypothetical protein PAXRUDRAFT_833968 [Paxillus rubicundulus Ve08.2h10]|uniref:Uncharacterized protein n=1 Tax=Paxillus rubicundulus Ve08.2h10 TaxID=930991 RepID=A0A0D0CW27_9AGAM|nr:hypothetical protein PAXRUDRAFT_833968 [Paxillus rubicundulus Ve08.2h10]
MQPQPEGPAEPKVDNDGRETLSGADEWEDVPDADSEAASQRELASSASDSQATSTVFLRKKRCVLTNTISVASPTPSKSQSAKPRCKKAIVSKEEAQEALTGGGRFLASFACDDVKGSIRMMRKPFSWVLFMWMFACLVSSMADTLRTAISPLCIVPGISRSTLCVPAQPLAAVDFPGLLDIQGSTFEKLLGESAAGSETSTGVLKAEMAIRDLSLLVRLSDLDLKDSIADVLDTIARDAKKTSRGLSKLHAKVLDGIDQVMALNNYAMTTIEGAHKKAPSPLLQAISPFKLGPTANEIISTVFTLAMDESEQTIAKLVLEADRSLQAFDQMDVDLATLYEITTRESECTAKEKAKVLGEVWTKFVGKQRSRREYGDRLELLDDIEEYRTKALGDVTATSRALELMSSNLEILRDRVAAPALLEGKVPLHVQMESIKNGVERLREGQMRSRTGKIGDENL